MSAATLTPTGPTSARNSAYRLTFGHVLKAEWIKFRSLRSTVWTLGITVVVMVLMAMAGAAQANFSADNPEMGVTMSGADALIQSFIFAQLSVAVLGVLLITGEYSTGMIRSTLSAVPSRLPALWAKVIVVMAATAVIAIVGIGLSYLVVTPMLSGNGLAPDLGDGTSQRILVAYVAYLMAIAAMAVGAGALLRHSAGAIFSIVALVFVLPLVAQIFSSREWVQDIAQFLPTIAGASMMSSVTEDGMLTPLQGTLTLVAWAVAAVVAAAVVLKRRDA